MQLHCGLLWLWLFLVLVTVTAQDQEDNLVEDDSDLEKEKRREMLRWFPADDEAECEDPPGAEQVTGQPRDETSYSIPV